jgi:hypothetical protein
MGHEADHHEGYPNHRWEEDVPEHVRVVGKIENEVKWHG